MYLQDSDLVSAAPEALSHYAELRTALLRRIEAILVADARVAAAWLSGSFGRGEADAWSDLDLHIAVHDHAYDGYLTERGQLYRRAGTPALIQNEMPSNSIHGGRFQLVLYEGPVEVDWNIGPLSHAERPVAYQMLIERAPVPIAAPPPLTPAERQARAADRLTFFWAMAPIAVKYAGRGETSLAARQLALLSNACLSLWRLVEQPDGPEPFLPSTNRPVEPHLDARLPRLGPIIDPLACLDVIRALCTEVATLHPHLSTLGVMIPAALPHEVAQLGRLAERVVRAGNLPRRPYR